MLYLVSATTASGLWLAPDHCHLGVALGHVALNDMEAIDNFIHDC